MLEIQGLNKSFGSFKALNDLTLSVGDGELFGFVGANGAGKTTTMKICVGLMKADSGQVLINGAPVLKNGRAVRSQVGYVPDFFGVYDHLTSIEYLQFFAGTYGIWGKKSEVLCESLLELVNLTDKRDTQVDSLSRGMKQRMCLARALVNNPGILFLDEPASGLDPKARHELKEILKNLTAMGKTIVISSHILPELFEMCTTIGIINHGEMKFTGSVQDAIMKQSGKILIEVLVNGDTKRASEILLETPGISNLTCEQNKLTFGTTGNFDDDSAILKKLVNSDVNVYSFRRSEENVEDIFLNIMEDETNDKN